MIIAQTKFSLMSEKKVEQKSQCMTEGQFEIFLETMLKGKLV